MQPASSTVAWSEVLQHVEAAVTYAVAEATERSRRLGDEPGAPTPASIANPLPALEQLGSRCQAVQAKGAGAAARVADVDAALAETEAALKQWLKATEEAREKLAAWVGRAVG